MYFQVYNHKKSEKQENKKYFNQKKKYIYIFTLPRYCSRYIEVATKSIDTVYRYYLSNFTDCCVANHPIIFILIHNIMNS